MNTPKDTVLLSLGDLKHICKKWKKSILLAAGFGALLAVLFALLSPVKYTSEATFYEKAKSDSVNNNGKNAALLLLGEERESSGIVMLKSHKIVEDAIKKLNLQASVEIHTPYPRLIRKFVQLLGNPRKNLLTQWSILSRSAYPLDIDAVEDITALEVVYEGEVPRYLDIHFTSPTSYHVSDSIVGSLGEGQLDVPFNNGGVQFALRSNTPLNLQNKRYELTLQPARKLAEKIASQLKVISDYKDKSFITLTLTYQTRQGTRDLVNAIMEAYRQHLVDEHHRVMASQVAYLKDRREAMEVHLGSLMHEHAEQLSSHAGNLEVLIATQQSLQKKLLTTDLEMKHIQQALKKGSYVQAHYISESDPPFVHQTVAEIRNLRHKSNAIQLALNDLPVQETFPDAGQEFQGIDIETANALYLSYCRELQETEANAIQNQFVIDKVQQQDFEITSLSSVLSDPVSSEIIHKVATLTLAKKDQSNRTQRELERLNEELDLQRNFLSSHLKQIVELLKLRVQLLYSKIQAVQGASLELLKQKISLQEQQLLDYASSRLNTLEQERTLINRQKQTLQLEFDKLPEQWASEKLVDLYLTADGSLMQHLGSLIESKNIADHLEISLSAPFDYGHSPLYPKSPHLLLFAMLGAFMGMLGTLGFALFKSVITGVEATADNLRLSGAYVAGSIVGRGSSGGKSTLENLETLRRLAAHLCPTFQSVKSGNDDKGGTLLILEPQEAYVAYAKDLASLLSMRKLKVLLIDLTFNQEEKSNAGLLAYLEGTTRDLGLIREAGYDFLPSGGNSSYGPEWIESEPFRKLLKEMQDKYDWVLGVSNAVPCSAEAESAIAVFDRVVVTVTNENLQELIPYIYLRKPCAFVLT